MYLKCKVLYYIQRQENGCWIWIVKPNTGGYGTLSYKGKFMLAHKYSYLAFVGQIPNKMWVLHKCDVRSCVNPEHLFLGPPKDNSDDRMKKGRGGNKKGECNGFSKLMADQIVEIRKLLMAGITHDRIARRFNVHRTTISAINQGVNWSCVT